MANKNKKIKRLVKLRDQNRPPELEIVPTLTQPVGGRTIAAAAGEQTYDVEEARLVANDKSRAELYMLLEQRTQSIEELEFQLEQSRSRQRGLEEEIRVREEIAETVNEDVRTARQQLTTAATELENLNAEYGALRSAFIAANERTQSMRVQADDSRRIAEMRHLRIAELERELAAAKTELSDLRGYIAGRRQDWEEQEQELARIRGDLGTAFDRIRELSDQLAQALSCNEAAEREKTAVREQCEKEIRQVRFELNNAQDTIADQETVSEQLASDLMDNLQFRQALEDHLSETKRDHEKTIRNLKRQLQKAHEESEEHERKLQAKDSVIADLMYELASQEDTTGNPRDLEHVLQKVDGFRSYDNPRLPRPDRDRVARLLVGEADGKELRFPLFKDRLTIGRTSHNDIQLDFRFISRRHAVIATDNNRTRIIDWGSRNGVFVNKKRITEKILSPGDVITIGLTDLRYEERSKR